MGSFSIWHWLIVFVVVMLLFGKGRFSDMMGDVAKGIKSFKKGMSDDEDSAAKGTTVHHIEGKAADPQPQTNPQASSVETRQG